MKPESIEERKARHRRQAVHGVVFFVVLQIICAVAFGSLCFIPDAPKWVVVLFGILAALCLVLIIPALTALKDRFKEIEGGEWYAAGQY